MDKSKLTIPSKDQYYLDIAKAVAQRSTCYYWKCGAIIVSAKDDIVGIGTSGAPGDTNSCIEKGYCPYQQLCGMKPDGSTRQCFGVHAELNAMLRASHEKMAGGSMYIYREDRETGKQIIQDPSDVDSRLIQNSGIKRIFVGAELNAQ